MDDSSLDFLNARLDAMQDQNLRLLNSRLDIIQGDYNLRLDGLEAGLLMLSARVDNLQGQVDTSRNSAPFPHEPVRRRPYLSEKMASTSFNHTLFPNDGGSAIHKSVSEGRLTTFRSIATVPHNVSWKRGEFGADIVENEMKETQLDDEDSKIEDTCELKFSVWDASLLLFVDELGFLGSVFSVLVLLLNGLLQFALSWVVSVSLTDEGLRHACLRHATPRHASPLLTHMHAPRLHRRDKSRICEMASDCCPSVRPHLFFCLHNPQCSKSRP